MMSRWPNYDLASMTTKIDFEIIVGRCHFILDSEGVEGADLTWKRFFSEYPLAFCVGCTEDNLDSHVTAFKSLGFQVLEEPHYNVTAFIARNTKFIEVFEGQREKRSASNRRAQQKRKSRRA